MRVRGAHTRSNNVRYEMSSREVLVVVWAVRRLCRTIHKWACLEVLEVHTGVVHRQAHMAAVDLPCKCRCRCRPWVEGTEARRLPACRLVRMAGMVDMVVVFRMEARRLGRLEGLDLVEGRRLLRSSSIMDRLRTLESRRMVESGSAGVSVEVSVVEIVVTVAAVSEIAVETATVHRLQRAASDTVAEVAPPTRTIHHRTGYNQECMFLCSLITVPAYTA